MPHYSARMGMMLPIRVLLGSLGAPAVLWEPKQASSVWLGTTLSGNGSPSFEMFGIPTQVGRRLTKVCMLSGSIVRVWGALESVLARYEGILSKSDRTMRVVRVDFGDSASLIGAQPKYERLCWNCIHCGDFQQVVVVARNVMFVRTGICCVPGAFHINQY